MTIDASLSLTPDPNHAGTYVVSGTVTLPVTPPPPPPPSGPKCQLGVWTPNNGGTDWSGIQAMGNVPVLVATYYNGWGDNYHRSWAQTAHAHGAIVLAELEPWNLGGFGGPAVPFTDILNGVYDSYLAQYGNDIAAMGFPVMLEFAHEMNGGWYPWGNGGSLGVTKDLWIQTYKYVHDKIDATANGLVSWVWAPNVDQGLAPVSDYWPGDRYVDIPAVDGYLVVSSDTYANRIAPTVAHIRALTTKPVWLAETGISPADSTRAARITQFVADIKADGLTGFMWFNQGTAALNAAEVPVFDAAINAWNA